jgi:hypothetical protein
MAIYSIGNKVEWKEEGKKYVGQVSEVSSLDRNVTDKSISIGRVYVVVEKCDGKPWNEEKAGRFVDVELLQLVKG